MFVLYLDHLFQFNFLILKIISIKNVETDFIINNGGHFMTITKSAEIEKIIKIVIR